MRRPLGDGAVQATPEMAKELPVAEVEEEERGGQNQNPSVPS